MGRRARELAENSSASSLSEALLFTTMCIIGLPVEVHVKDGSVYSGIFHTACVESDYGIVLKKARMTMRGKHEKNVANESVVDTLIVMSSDLVQVIAKGVSFPSSCNVEDVADDDVGYFVFEETRKNCKFSIEGRELNQTRILSPNENGFAHGFTPPKFEENILSESKEEFESEEIASVYLQKPREAVNGETGGIQLPKCKEACIVRIIERQVECEGSQGGDDYHKETKIKFHGESTPTDQRSRSNLNACLIQGNPQEKNCVKAVSKNLQDKVFYDSQFGPTDPSHLLVASVSTSPTSTVDIRLESRHISLASSPEMAPPQGPVLNTNAKEFKLNPGAKVFSPSPVTYPQTASPPPAPAVVSMAYPPSNPSVVPLTAARPETGFSTFTTRPSLPVKVVPYSNLVASNSASSLNFSQPVVGQTGTRIQPIRYAGQYHPVQTGPAVVHSNSPPVMVGRVGQLIYVHPVSHDVVQGAAAISSVPPRPLLTPHQVQISKLQGVAPAQTLQLCVSPPYVSSGQAPAFAIPSQVQLVQSPFLANRSIVVPGAYNFFSPKYP